MIKVESKVTRNTCQDEQLYNFVSDFRNLATLFPPEYRDKVTFAEHSITIEAMQGMFVTFSILEQEPHRLIKLGVEASRDFFIWIQIKQVAPYDTRIRITMHAEIPKIAGVFAKKKLQIFVDTFAETLAQIPVYAFQTNNLN
ncbi:MAG: hypothetical protein LBM68_02175 [Bacteroidales bacterium]|jgi:hypothetical protein|nr:hypothetical protein [Bacteroidales bacterium]